MNKTITEENNKCGSNLASGGSSKCKRSIMWFNERTVMAAARGANTVRSRPRALGGARATHW